jgi:hypothetical protein
LDAPLQAAVSVEEAIVCIVGKSKIVQEVKVASEPKALLAVLEDHSEHGVKEDYKQVGIELTTSVSLDLLLCVPLAR